MVWDNSRGRGTHHHRGSKRKHYDDGRSNNDQQNAGDQQDQQDQQDHHNQPKKQKQQNQENQQNKQHQQNQQSNQNGSSQQNDKFTKNRQNNSKGSNAKTDWNNGWVGHNHHKGKDNGESVNHCCLWQEVSQDPYLRQVYGHFSQFLADNKNSFCPSSPPSSIEVVMREALRDKKDWHEKVEQMPNASMLLSTEAGRFISQALHGYFEPCMNVEALNETYMIVQQDATALSSRLVGKYMVHSRNPFLPNGPKDLFVQIKVTLKPKRAEMLISPCDTNGFKFEGPVSVMNKYRRELSTPIDGYEVVGELDASPNGMYLSLIMGQAERAWEYISSSLIKCPQ